MSSTARFHAAVYTIGLLVTVISGSMACLLVRAVAGPQDSVWPALAIAAAAVVAANMAAGLLVGWRFDAAITRWASRTNPTPAPDSTP